jgi:hypothetical protein
MPEFDCPNPVNLSVRVGGGTVEIVAEERSTASVEVSPFNDSDESREAAANTRVEMTRDELIVDGPEAAGWIFRRGVRIRVAVRVPLDSRLALKVASADARCQGRFGSATIKSGSGDVTVDEVTGDLSAENASGDLAIRRAGGQVNVSSASGDVQVGYAGGDASVTSASGDVAIDEAENSVAAKTASGDIRVGVVRRGEAKLNSASGDVSVGVPAGTGVWLDLTTMSGSTTSDLTMSDAAPAEGGAQLTLQVRTMSGDIEVRRVNQPANA